MHAALQLEDVLEQIFDYLGVAALMRCRRVCKCWRGVIERLRSRLIGSATLFIPEETDQDERLRRICSFLHESRVYPDIVLCLSNNAAYLDLKTLALDERSNGRMVPLIQAVWKLLPAKSHVVAMVGEGIVAEAAVVAPSPEGAEAETTSRALKRPTALLDALPTDLSEQEPFGCVFVVLSAAQAHGIHLRLASFRNEEKTVKLLTRVTEEEPDEPEAEHSPAKARECADKLEKLVGVPLRNAIAALCLRKTHMWEDELSPTGASNAVHFDWLLVKALRRMAPSCSVLGLRSLCELLLRPSRAEQYVLPEAVVDSDTVLCIVAERAAANGDCGRIKFSVLELNETADCEANVAAVLDSFRSSRSADCEGRRNFALQLSCTFRAEKLFRGRPNLECGAFADAFPLVPLLGVYVRNGIFYVDCDGDQEQLRDMVTRQNWTLFVMARL